MPIANIQDTTGVEQKLQEILSSADVDRRLQAIRELFVGILDYDSADQLVSLESAGNAQLSKDAHVAARRDGVTVAYISLDDAHTNRVNGMVVSAAAKALGNILADDLLLVFTNRDRDQLHIIRPDLSGSRPKLQRLVAYRDQLQRTVPQQIANMWDNYGNKGKTLQESIKEAFDVEPVTADFFETYRKLFEDAKEEITGFTPAEEEQKHLFTQTLFNRLMFVYFLSRKGWLKFDGNTDYLKALWTNYDPKSSTGNFYITRLRMLFFRGLNNPNPGNLSDDEKALIGEVPFLNGGLFEETDLDKRPNIQVPDETIGHILTNLFERFNFTVMESTPYDVEVAVDPEMLGKVFEELVTGRHDSGAYYTPRPVVSFMCREALKGYLEGKETGLDQEAIARFVDEHDTSGISLIGAPRVSEALSEVTVVDPACGSGAYLLGMMQELTELQTILYNIVKDDKKIYDLKLEIIRRNLYGVDIDKFAVNTAMLRMWLSLAIDYEGEEPKPLPNLDFKVVRGDSLLGPDPSVNVEIQGTLGQDVEQFRNLGRLKAAYLPAYLDEAKEDLRQQIEKLTGDIRKALGVSAIADTIDWRTEFTEIFVERGGFDIAIANPPYVRFQKIPQAYKRSLKPIYSASTEGKSDLYCYFYARALQLLADGGMHVFVCSNSWLDVGYGARLQNHLINSSHIMTIYESAVERQFSTADINTIVSLLRKGTTEGDTRFVSLQDEIDRALADKSLQREVVQSRAELIEAGTRNGEFKGDKWGGKFLRAPSIYHHILTNYGDRLIRLGNVAQVKRGIISGANPFFFMTYDAVEDWGIENEFVESLVRTPQDWMGVAVNVEKLPYKAFVCHQPETQLRGTNALEYIKWGESEGFHLKSAPAARKLWYDLGNRQKTRTGINIFVSSHARTILTSQPILFSDNFQTIMATKVDSEPLCLSLNSTFSQLAINVEGRVNFGQGVLEIQTYEVANFNIVHPSLIPDFDLTILDSPDWGVMEPSNARLKADQVVFDILGLTSGEREAVYEGLLGLITNRSRRAGSV